jgi:hypothetical protein
MARRKAADRTATRRLPLGKRRLRRPSKSPRKDIFTLADFVALLRSAPKPDAEYWNLVEAITRNQSQVQPSAWES